MEAASTDTVQTRPLAGRRIAFVSGSARTLLGSRAPLIKRLVGLGCPVLCMAPEFSTEQQSRLAFMGAETVGFEIEPKGPRLFADWRVSRDISDVLGGWKPDVVVAMSERVMALTLLACRRARVSRRIALVNGFSVRGIGFDQLDDPLRSTPRLIARALRHADLVIYHNRDDLAALRRANAIAPTLATHHLPGAGVDLTAFAAQPLPPVGDGLVFLMIAALEEARGVLDYCEAASRVKTRAPQARFLLAGPVGDGASAIGPEMIRPYAAAVSYLGPLADVRPALAQCHAFVYPSRAEGMPRAVFEALATARPVITTSAPGCRETVDDCVSGRLVAPGDVAGLADAMTAVLKRPDLLASMSRAARHKAETQFDERPIIDAWLDLLEGRIAT